MGKCFAIVTQLDEQITRQHQEAMGWEGVKSLPMGHATCRIVTVDDCNWYADGTCDVGLVAVDSFMADCVVLEEMQMEVPGAAHGPKLSFGLLRPIGTAVTRTSRDV